MFKNIFRESIKEVLQNPKTIRVAFWTWLFQNTFIFLDIIYLTNNILHKYWYTNMTSREAINYILDFSSKFGLWTIVFVVIIMFFVWMVIINPIWKNMIIYILDTGKINTKKSFENYFIAVLVFGILWAITLWTEHINILYYIVMMEVGQNIIMQIFIWMLFLVFLVWTILTPFAYYIALLWKLDWWQPEQIARKAIWQSASLVSGNIWTTIKFTILQFVLHIRFFINLAFVLWLPVLLWYLLYMIGLFSNNTIFLVSWIFGFIILVFVIYINTFIETFFIIFWYKLYKTLIQNEEQ